MFRTARVTFDDDRFGETITDIFRVWDDPEDPDIHRLTKAVDQALHDAGFRDFRVIWFAWAN